MKQFYYRKPLKIQYNWIDLFIRKEWLIWMFEGAGKKNVNNVNRQLWQQDNRPIELWDNYMIDNKLNYIHNNPVDAGIVNNAEDYVYSSAIDYTGQKGLIKVESIM